MCTDSTLCRRLYRPTFYDQPWPRGGGARTSLDLKNKNCGLSKHQTQNKHNIRSKIYVCPAKCDETLSDNLSNNFSDNSLLDEDKLIGNNIYSNKNEHIETASKNCSEISDKVKDFQDQNAQPNEGELLPNFDTWFKEMMGDEQTVEHGGGDGQHDGVQEGQVREEGVHAQGGEVMGEGEGGEGGEGGQGVKVKLAVERLEEGNTGLKLPRFVKPSGRRGVK